MPLPSPEFTRESEGVGTGCLEKLPWRERHRLGAEDQATEAEKRDHKQKLERIDDVVSYLRGSYVETEDESYREAEKGGAADDGINTYEETYGDAPG